ncbi:MULTISPECIES: ABC transporter substrate-binding protein [Oceanibaculum]|uniref:ABC transporter ATP-binding protein n=2 Tax=Oceanibaculum indicum TaxID=526216 RepID=K2J378_9PROT|nr:MULTISPECIES: ABC transporter substrate-binding protein [Oceanibaculum]EKE69538.1 ABC transporter ATP-binding protein [Oceanibaculum indicum P24]MCH2396047.1 ABC transporter substrate-binding protein [Oceanibaculum sp.]RKQ68221.1 branched-chain amino acid transport system substrate-binding protein [Oceanibaculum indicum]
MTQLKGIKAYCAGAAAAAALFVAAPAQADIKIGVIFDYTGPFAAGGSQAAAIGTKSAIDIINERGGVEGHKIVATYADAQSKAEVAINEMTRLLEQEKVDVIMGVFSSAHCVPMAQRVDQLKKFMWANVCVASSVFKGKNLQYAFRAQVHSDQFGAASCTFTHENAKAKLGKDPKDVRVAIIYEDGPYGAGVASGNEAKCKELGMNIVLKEGYAATAPDLSSLVTKLRRERPDVILHTGYNPDITLFLRQARELGLKWGALIGHGAGYGQIDKLRETFGADANYIYNVDPVAAQLLDPKTLAPGLGDVTAEMVKRYKAETKADQVPPHTSMGFNQTWIFLTDVLPRAIKKYGGFDPEALRKAALDTDIPVGGTIQGYGVKFYGPGTEMAGQNERSSPVVMQYIDGDTKVVWPAAIKTVDPVLPLPKGHVYAR